MAYNATWTRSLAPDGKHIVYFQPAIDNPFGRHFDLYLEDVDSGKQKLVAEDVASTPPVEMGPTYILEWSLDSELFIFFHQGFLPSVDGFGFLANKNGEILQRWEGWFHDPQWTSDLQTLAFSGIEKGQPQAKIYLWRRAQNRVQNIPMPADQFPLAIKWSPIDNRLAIVDGTSYAIKDRAPEYYLRTFSEDDGYLMQSVIPYSGYLSNYLVSLDWADNGHLINIRIREDYGLHVVQSFNSQSGTLLSAETVRSSASLIDHPENVVPIRSTIPYQVQQIKFDIVLPDVPNSIEATFLTESDHLSPFWRHKEVQSGIILWSFQEQLRVTRYDVNTGQSTTFPLSFHDWQNLETYQVNRSDLIAFQLESRIGAHSGVFDARTGEFILEFMASDISSLPVYYDQKIRYGVPLDQSRIYGFTDGTDVTYFDQHGKHLFQVAEGTIVQESPDEKHVLWIRYQNYTPYLSFYDMTTQQTQTYQIEEYPPGYIVRWSPESEFVLIYPAEGIRIFSRDGESLWKFPGFNLRDYYGGDVYDWVRCDIFTRWGDIEVIDRGRAERG